MSLTAPKQDNHTTPYQPIAHTSDGDASQTLCLSAEWQIMANIIECCLLENWLSPNHIISTSTSLLMQQPLWLKTALYSALPTAYHDLLETDSDCLHLILGDGCEMMIQVEHGFCSPWRLKKSTYPVVRLAHSTGICVEQISQPNDAVCYQVITDSKALLALLLQGLANNPANTSNNPQGINLLQEQLKLAKRALLWSQQNAISNPHVTPINAQAHWYQTWRVAEQWASLCDRPFHPLAKAKIGFDQADYQAYMAEFNQPICLNWVALDKRYVMYGSGVADLSQQTPANLLLSAPQYQALNQEMCEKNLSTTHITIPVHPWQLPRMLERLYGAEHQQKIVVVLDFQALTMLASSSTRSLLLDSPSAYSTKLPLAIFALNSQRYLPPLKLINGEKNQRILQQAKTLDATLKAQLYLWEETQWWTYMEQGHCHDKSSDNPYFYQEKPTQLGILLRRLPEEVCRDTTRLIPMASLAHYGSDYHLFDEWFKDKLDDMSRLHTAVQEAFAEICEIFFGTMLRCLKLGFIPELHGQNIVLVTEQAHTVGLLLRDHDSVRIYLPWLTEQGIADPCYLSPPNFRNRLYCQSATELLFYFQSLGILVNIRAIIESLANHYQIDEASLWQVAYQQLTTQLATLALDEQRRIWLIEQLLEQPNYPYKTLLLPIAERGDEQHGSMPAGASFTTNPFYQISHQFSQ